MTGVQTCALPICSKETVNSGVSNDDLNLTGGSLLDLSEKSNETNKIGRASCRERV